MDICAIANASHKVLEELGLTKAGDRLNLIAYCKSEANTTCTTLQEANEKKRSLLDAFLTRKKEGKTRNKSSKRSDISLHQEKQMNKIKTKKVHLGWKHFRNEDDAFVFVPLSKGGGSRTVDVPINVCRTDLIKTCKDLFFPNGQSIFGDSDEMLTDLANFKNEKINETIKIGDRIVSFNIANYMEAHKIKTVRIYLRTKKVPLGLDSDDDDDVELDTSLIKVSKMLS